MSIGNKSLVSKAKTILKDLGYEVKTTHVYELLSRLSGDQNQNVSAARKTDFTKLFVETTPLAKQKKENENIEFIEAALRGDITLVKEMTKEVFDINEFYNDSLMMDVVMNNQYEVAKYLMESGYNQEYSLAHGIAYSGSIKMFNLFVDHKNVDRSDKQQQRWMFHTACEFNRLDLMKFIMEKNTHQFNFEDIKLGTIIAISSGSIDVLRSLDTYLSSKDSQVSKELLAKAQASPNTSALEFYTNKQ